MLRARSGAKVWALMGSAERAPGASSWAGTDRARHTRRAMSFMGGSISYGGCEAANHRRFAQHTPIGRFHEFVHYDLGLLDDRQRQAPEAIRPIRPFVRGESRAEFRKMHQEITVSLVHGSRH